MFYCHSVCSGVLKISGQNYDNFILSKSLLYLSVVVSMCLPSTFSQKHKHCFQTILLLRLLLRLLFGIVLLYWIMCLVFLHHIQGFWSRKNYELVMHPCSFPAGLRLVFQKRPKNEVPIFCFLLLKTETKERNQQSDQSFVRCVWSLVYIIQ